MRPDLEGLADQVVAGESRRAIAACEADVELARVLSRAVAARLVEQAASHVSAVDPHLIVWPSAQDAVVALATVAGADARALASALLRCCVHESVSGESDQLGEAGLRLILDHHTAVVEQLFRLDRFQLDSGSLSPPWPMEGLPSTRFLVDAMWTLHGAEGARWMDRLLDYDPWEIVSRRPRTWTADDWTARLDMLSDRHEIPQEAYALELRMLDFDDPAPREAAPALTRYACSRFTAGQSPRIYLGRAANVLALHRSGDPEADVELYWWDAETEDEIAALRWVLELVGPAGTRASLVAVAAARRLIRANVAGALAAEMRRPLWADRDVPWVVTEVREEGISGVPDAVAQRLGAERLWARTVIAAHPVHGRVDAAVEWLVEPDAQPLRWKLAGDGLWLGREAKGSVARAICDLGVLALDLEADQPPWFVHDRVPPAGDEAPEPSRSIDKRHLHQLALDGLALRHQRRALREALHQRGIGEYASAVVLGHVRDGIALVAADSPGRSRLGGPGRLPVGTPWPELRGLYLSPLAELALAELPSLDPLPADGTLLLFADT